MKNQLYSHLKRGGGLLCTLALLLTTLLALSVCCVQTKAAPTYRTAELRRLAVTLGLNVDTLREGVNSYTTQQNRQVKLYYTNGQVTFLGYHLFPEELKAVARTPVMSFLERYFLQMDYPQADRPRDRMLREDRFRVETGSLSMIESIREDDEFSCACEMNRYVATWSRDGEPLLSVSFPAEHELISGENKQESEEHVETDVRHARTVSSVPVTEASLSATIQKNYFVKQGGTYLNKALSSDLYYERVDSAFVLVSDASHPLETSANMMLSPDSETSCQLKVKQVMYGFRKKNYEIPLKNWIAYCLGNGCKLYYGVETFNANGIKASVFAVNEAEGYNHVLNVQIPLTVVETATGTIDARLETFIPMHNVRNLFGKYKKNRNKQSKTYTE